MDVDITGVDLFFNYLVHSPHLGGTTSNLFQKGRGQCHRRKCWLGSNFFLARNTTNYDSLSSHISKMGNMIIPLEEGSWETSEQ